MSHWLMFRVETGMHSGKLSAKVWSLAVRLQPRVSAHGVPHERPHMQDTVYAKIFSLVIILSASCVRLTKDAGFRLRSAGFNFFFSFFFLIFLGFFMHT